MLDKNKKQKIEEFLNELEFKRTITENEINRLRNLLNNSAYREDYKLIIEDYNFNDYDITSQQSNKGKQYLIKKYLTKNRLGFRKNCCLSHEFQELILTQDLEFKFMGFARLSNGIWNYYAAIYKCFSIKRNKSFEYFNFNCYDYEISEPGTYLKNSQNVYYVDRI